MVEGPAVGAPPASGHPSASTMTEPPTQSTPRSWPVRSHAAIEHAVHGGVRLHAHDLRGPLTVGAWERRPVDRGAEQLRTVQGGNSYPFGDFQVVADQHSDPAERRVNHRRRGVPCGEQEVLGVPEVRLAVDAAEPTGIDEGGTIEHLPGCRLFAEAADDDDLVVGGEPRPEGQCFAVRGLRAGGGFGPILEEVAAGDQLGQHHDAGAERDGVDDCVGDALAVCGRIAQGWGELAAGHHHGIHRPAWRGLRPKCRVHGAGAVCRCSSSWSLATMAACSASSSSPRHKIRYSPPETKRPTMKEMSAPSMAAAAGPT